jgi:acyl carrier protein
MTPMAKDDIKPAVIDALTGVAPEIDPATIDPALDLREQFDLDSMDFLNFVIALHERFGVDIPEAEYPSLASLDGAMAYLEAKLATQT